MNDPPFTEALIDDETGGEVSEVVTALELEACSFGMLLLRLALSPEAVATGDEDEDDVPCRLLELLSDSASVVEEETVVKGSTFSEEVAIEERTTEPASELMETVMIRVSVGITVTVLSMLELPVPLSRVGIAEAVSSILLCGTV